jgi:D-glycero-D-manno-heptose 1,7-bisphosphate phosphatase
MTLKLVILDRDGTINETSDEFVKSPEEWRPLPGALEAIARLTHAGWRVVLAANQSGLGRGLFDVAAVNGIHTRLNRMLATVGGRIDAVFFCPHAPDEDCHCRKPRPGLFEQIGERYGISLDGVPAPGDSPADLQAAAAAGCEPHLVLTGRAAHLRADALPPDYPAGTRVHADLGAFADFVIAREARGRPSGAEKPRD